MIGAIIDFNPFGPPAFMETTKGLVAELGIHLVLIRQETFGGAGAAPKAPLSPSAAAGLSFEFARSGKTITASEGESRLAVAAATGVDIPSACRQGRCGTCKTRLLDGHVEMACENGLDPEPKAKGYVLTLRCGCGWQREAECTKAFVFDICSDLIGFCTKEPNESNDE